MTAEPLLELSLETAGDLIRRRELSPVDVTKAVIHNIESQESTLHAFISVAAEPAMEAAHDAERRIAGGDYRGPLHGLPIAIKDNIFTRDLVTTAGSRILADHVPTEDATVVQRLREAGAIVIGKTNLHEFAWGGTTDNPHYGQTRNPWDTSRFPGGSSGGSAVAVAARMCFGALGTDTDGSVRVPSAFNGVVGLRPTSGRVSNHNVVPLAWSMDTVGPIGRSARDCFLMLSVMAGRDAADPSTVRAAVEPPRWGEGAQGLRIAVDESYCFTELQPDVEAALRSALNVLQDLGASVVPIQLGDMAGNVAAELTVVGSEASTYHGRWLRDRADEYGDDVRLQLELGEMYLATHYIQAQRYRTLLRQSTLAILEQADVILSPSVSFTAIPVGDTRVRINSEREVHAMTAVMRYTGLASLTGLPALSVPCGFARDGLPVGMQLLGKPFAEHTLLQAADAYQSVTDWHRRTPYSR